MNKSTNIIRPKRIGDIEVKRCKTEKEKYEIIKWYYDHTAKEERCYVITFVDIDNGKYYFREIHGGINDLLPNDMIDYPEIVKYIKNELKSYSFGNSESVKNKQDTGMKNDFKDNKLRWDLLPFPEIEDIVKVYHYGAQKYAPESWKNLPDGFERYRAAMLRHLAAYMNGERIDEESGLMHLAQVAWNAIALLWYDKNGKGLIPTIQTVVDTAPDETGIKLHDKEDCPSFTDIFGEGKIMANKYGSLSKTEQEH